MNRPSLPLVLALLLAGCQPESAPPAPADAPAGVSLNGTSVAVDGPARSDECFSTTALSSGAPAPYAPCHNGPLLSGPVVSVALSPVTLADGRSLDAAAALGGTTFSGAAGGVPVQGTDFLGAVFTATLASGGAVPIRIDSATQGTGVHADVWAYGFSYRDGSGAWQPVCAGGVAAVPLLGRWDYSQGTSTGGDKIDDPSVFTVGCIGSAVTKCVYLGYKPWKTVAGVALGNHHQACVRAIRADYCGNGTSYTTTGRVIDIYDNLGIQADTEGWLSEGEWTPAGAKCTYLLNRNIVAGVLCNPVGTLTCGLFTSGVLVLTETPLSSTGLLGVRTTQPR